MRKRLIKKHFVFKLQKNARRGDAFASDCSSWKTHKELGCTINQKESNRPVSMASDEPNSAFERDSSNLGVIPSETRKRDSVALFSEDPIPW